MKLVNEVLGKIKGENNVNEVMTGKGAFSKSGFGDVVSAMVNDTTFKIPTYDKNGAKTGEVSISEMIRSDIKKTIEKAKFPQKSESAVLDTCEVTTTGLAEAIPYLVAEQLKCGKKFDIPQGKNYVGSVYLGDVKGRVKEVQVRDPKTQENLGTCTITTKDSVQVKTKSPVPQFLSSKVRKDKNGKVI